MSGTIFSGTYGNGVVLSDPGTQNPATIGTSGRISNSGTALYGEAGAVWTVTNLGAVVGTAGPGIVLAAGGTVDNIGIAALISGEGFGVGYGVAIHGTNGGVVINFGMIESTSTYGGVVSLGIGVGISAGGTVTQGVVANYGTISGEVSIIERVGYGRHQSNIPVGTVTNFGYVGGAAEAATVSNSGTIMGPVFGSTIVSNFGNIGPAAYNSDSGVTGATVINYGVIANSYVPRSFNSTAYAARGFNYLANFGTITASGSRSDGVTAPTLANLGTIEAMGAGGIGISVVSDVRGLPNLNIRFSNGGPGSAGALISGYYRGVLIKSFTFGDSAPIGTIANYGTIESTGGGYSNGVYLGAGGTVTNSGAITGTSGAGIGLDINGYGSLANAAIGLVAGYAAGMKITGAAGSVVNYGTIAATGSYGVGLYLGAGGTIGNAQYGSIAGPRNGIVMDGAGYIGNSGMVVATGSSSTGVYLGSDGITLVNSGMIAGHYGIGVGVSDIAGNTVVNAGTIVGYGGGAVFLGPSGDLLVVDPGAVFIGAVYAGGSTIELSAGGYTGSLSGLGTNFAGFATVRVDAGANWNIAGGGSRFVNDGTVIVDGALVFSAVGHDPGSRGVIQVGNGAVAEFGSASSGEAVVFTDDTGTVLLDRPRLFHAVFVGFGSGDTIDLTGKQADGVLFGQHQLILTEQNSIVADLHFAGRYTTSDFALSPDGNGGTDITFAAPASRTEFWTIKG
jgi:fibronectin-binding autotransporter adhesin